MLTRSFPALRLDLPRRKRIRALQEQLDTFSPHGAYGPDYSSNVVQRLRLVAVRDCPKLDNPQSTTGDLKPRKWLPVLQNCASCDVASCVHRLHPVRHISVVSELREAGSGDNRRSSEHGFARARRRPHIPAELALNCSDRRQENSFHKTAPRSGERLRFVHRRTSTFGALV